MSFQALNWATGLVVGSSTAKFVLMALANYADEDGMCFPSVSMLMDDTELSKRAVSGAIKRLCDMGLLATERQRKEDGSLGRNRYRLQLNQVIALTECADSEDRKPGEPGAPDAHGETAGDQVHVVPSPGAPHDQPCARGAPPIDEPPIEPPSEPSVERERASARTPQGAEGDQPGGSPSGEVGERKTKWLVFRRKWPNADIDDMVRAKAVWDGMPIDELDAAANGIGPYFEALNRKGRTKALAAVTYLKQAKWQYQDAKPQAGGKYMPPWAKPWSPLWMASLIELLRTGQARPAMFDLSQAKGGTGASLRFGQDRDGELVAAVESFERVPTHSPRWKAWQSWVEGRLTDLRVGAHHMPRLRNDPDNPFWLSVPSDAMAKAWGITLDVPSADTHPPPKHPTDDDASHAFDT